MTVIAWDGHILAGDKRSSSGTLIRTVTKIHRLQQGRGLVGFAGESAHCRQMLAWLNAGENPETIPANQKDKDDWVMTMVIRPDKKIHLFERSAYPFILEQNKYAIGSGRDFAIMAMHLGKTAREAVILTAMYDSSCGNGVDVLEMEDREGNLV